MKSLITILYQFARDRPTRMNIFALLRYLGFVAVLVGIYSVIFHYIMEYEGRSESWVTGIYWTLTVMSTLGFGDITFSSDLGKIFSSVVLLSGIMLLLVVLPFTFIEFFYAPWMKAQQALRAPTHLPEKTRDHVILTQYDTVTRALIERFKNYQYQYVLLVPDITEALRLHDLGYKVMRGDLDDPRTYQLARVDQAMFVATTASDQVNANVAFTVREISETVPIIATANVPESVDILELAGSSYVLQLGVMMGQALARQVASGASTAHTIGTFEDLRIVEAAVRGTSLVGKTLEESQLRETVGINVLGIWARGAFETASAQMRITENAILVMAGTDDHIDRYNALYRRDTIANTNPVIIIGGGRVGRAVGAALAARQIDYRIVEKAAERIRDTDKYIHGSGAEIEVLERAGIREAPSIIITTHDDDMNVYLTIYCRRLRANAQIISRSAHERNIATLHRAGADFVMSYASTGANAIINLVGRDSILMVSEGLDVFEVDIPDALIGTTIAESDIRRKTGCTVVAVRDGSGVEALSDPNQPLLPGMRLIVIGVPESEEHFLRIYKD